MTDQPTNQPTDVGTNRPTVVEAVGGVRLADGTTARVRVVPLRITSLLVPLTTAREVEGGPVRSRTRFTPTPTLVGRAAVPKGPGAGGTTVGDVTTFVQAFPLLVWRWTHGFGRRPAVEVFQGLGPFAEEVDTDVRASATEVVVEWAVPTVGSVELR